MLPLSAITVRVDRATAARVVRTVRIIFRTGTPSNKRTAVRICVDLAWLLNHDLLPVGPYPEPYAVRMAPADSARWGRRVLLTRASAVSDIIAIRGPSPSTGGLHIYLTVG